MNFTDQQIGILQEWIDGELSEEQAMTALNVTRVQARQMKLDALAAGFVVELEDEHGHLCPDCGNNFLCYQDCPEELPYKNCGCS